MEMATAFTDVLHVANLTTGAHLMSVLAQADAFSKVTSSLKSLAFFTLFKFLFCYF